MPLHEANHVRRDRWPLEFDLEGIPRATAERERLLAEHRLLETISSEETMQGTHPVQNNFAASYQTGGTVVDINNPPVPRYGTAQNPHQEYPKMLYPANWPLSKPVLAQSKEQEENFLKKKYTVKPPKVEKVEESA